MEQNDKPRLAEVLGINVGVKFRVLSCPGVVFWLTDDGYYETEPPRAIRSSYGILDAINHPESIIRAPRLTEEELERCRVYGAKWVSRNDFGSYIDLWDKQPNKNKDGVY